MLILYAQKMSLSLRFAIVLHHNLGQVYVHYESQMETVTGIGGELELLKDPPRPQGHPRGTEGVTRMALRTRLLKDLFLLICNQTWSKNVVPSRNLGR